MLKNKLVIFIAKRELVLFILFTILDILLVRQRWYVFMGLAAGSVFGLLKFGFFGSVISSLLAGTGKPNATVGVVVKYIVNNLSMIALMAASVLINFWLFFGVVAGIFLVPLVVIINGITEGLGITHNKFE